MAATTNTPIRLEAIAGPDCPDVMGIDRSDVSEDWVDSIPDIMALHRYGLEHRLIGHTYAIYEGSACVGMLLIGEGIPWPCDPPELAGVPFYRLMGFVIDRSCRGRPCRSFRRRSRTCCRCKRHPDPHFSSGTQDRCQAGRRLHRPCWYRRRRSYPSG